jgi:predicted metal-dependent enzyme (double-stranded beta helix superfamily)
MKSLPIPEQEQLQALASGLKDVYRLLAEYVGDLNKVPNIRKHITITKTQLAEYLRQQPQLAEQHVARPSDPKYHESLVLERTEGKYRVYEIDHGQPRYVSEFADLANAAAEYLMWRW